MGYAVLTIAVLVLCGLLVLPAAIPALESIDPTGEAQAGLCVIGSRPGCIIQIVCIREPCP